MIPVNLAKSYRLLVVDDNRAIHEDFRRILAADSPSTKLGLEEAALSGNSVAAPPRTLFNLSFALKGREAFDLVLAACRDDRRYSLVFMDAKVPSGWDGVEASVKLWEIDPDLQIVICTDDPDKTWEEMLKEGQSPERLLILKKPFDTIEVLQLAHALTEKWMFLQSSRHSREEMEKLESMVAIRTRQLQQSNYTLQLELLEHKRAEEELQWKTAFLEAQVNSSSDGILVVDQQGNKALLNQRFIDLFQIPEGVADEILDENRLRWVTDRIKNPEQFADKVAHLYAHPDEIGRDEIELKNGMFLDRYSSPVVGKDGKYYGRIWTFRDITGRKLDEEALRENEERFSGAFEHAPIGVGLVAPDGRWLRVNRALCNLVGYSEEELRERTFQDITHADDLEPCLESVRQMITGEVKTCQSEKRYVHRDGHFVWVSFNLSLVRDEKGQPLYLIAQIQDITERKQAEEQLAAKEVLLRQFIRHAPAAIAMLDTEMRYVRVSERWIQDYHLTGQNIIGRSHYEIFPEMPQRWKDIHQRVLAGAIEGSDEDPFLRANGSTDWLQWEAQPWREAGGQIGGLIFFTQLITERKNAELEIRFNERRYRSLVEATTAIVWDTPASGEFETGQPGWSAFTGQSFEQLRGWGWLNAIHPDDQAETARIWSFAVANLTPYEGEHRLRAADGTYRNMMIRGVPILAEDGRIRQWIGVHTDITLRKQIEEALRESEERFRSYFELGLIGMAITSPANGWIEVNDQVCQMLGYERSELLQRTWVELTHPGDLAGDLAELDRVLAGETDGYSLNKRFIRKDGGIIDTTMSAKCLRRPDGAVDYFVVLMQDITARKVAEEELSQSRQKLRGILDHIPQRVFWKNRDSVFQGCNNAFALDMGFTDSSEVVGKTDFEISTKALAELYRADDQGVIDLDAAKFNFEEPGRAADGSLLWLRTSKVPLHDQQGRVSGILGTYEDVTQAKLDKLEIQKLEAHLVQSQKLETVGKLAGGIAHEFNSILTAIMGQSELLLNDLPASSPLARSAGEISRAAGRAATLTRQLLAYGRKQFLQPEILDLNRILGGMKDMLQHLMGGEVEILVHSNGMQAVKADAGQIEQVIINMVINARDAMPQGGKLTLETDSVSFAENIVGNYPELAPGDYVTLTITDTGVGMSAEVKARVFEPFFSTKAAGEGTGLGLSTCYGIIRQSGGHIGVYSEPGRGSSFKIYLPQIKQEPGIPVSPPAALDLPGGTETILLVEDDPALREMAGVLLRRLGYHVLEAAHGIEALAVKQRVGTGHIDLLFTDIVMPHMSGKELAERVRGLFPKTRILFTSAYTEKAMTHQGMLGEGAALLQKPFTPSALALKIREVLDS